MAVRMDPSDFQQGPWHAMHISTECAPLRASSDVHLQGEIAQTKNQLLQSQDELSTLRAQLAEQEAGPLHRCQQQDAIDSKGASDGGLREGVWKGGMRKRSEANERDVDRTWRDG